MRITKLVAAFAILAIAPTVVSRVAQANGEEEPPARCAALAAADWSGIQDAPAQVTEATLVEAQADMPSYCRARGYVIPQVGFEIRLPVSWNRRFLMVGCGGMCGVLWTERGVCDVPVREGYACIASDLGHRASDFEVLWTYNNLQAKIDWGYRATHVATLAGKAITQQYYGSPQQRAYFMGCSKGGEQGLAEAQRFPWDYDGILAGAPNVYGLDLVINHLSAMQAAQRGKLTQSTLELLHEAALAKCDLDDGVKDGIIGYPPACKFDPFELACKGEKQTKGKCLTEEEAGAAKTIYAGATNSAGERIGISGPAIGSERRWRLNIVPPDGGGYKSYLTDVLRYLAFLPDAGPGWQLSTLDPEREYRRLGMMNVIYAAGNPDLRRFKAAGRKFILYSGWNDEFVVPGTITDYYELVERTMGGRKATQEFFRLFMLPGVNHCSGGPGADAVDFLGHLEAWVEQGQAPDRILSAHVDEEEWGDYPFRRFPRNLSAAKFTRPLYPYPLHAKYIGRDDPKDAANFRAVQ